MFWDMITDFGDNRYLAVFGLGLLLGLVLEVVRVLQAAHARFPL